MRAVQPQVAIAGKVRPILNALDASNWEKSFSDMLAVISADRETDPFLKFNLLQQVLETGAKGIIVSRRHSAATSIGSRRRRINSSANWLDPKILSVSAREAAVKVMKSFPENAEPDQSLEKELRSLGKNKIPEYRWIGWLGRTKDGSWKRVANRGMEGSGNVFAVGRSPSNSKLLLVAVGRLDRKKCVIDAKSNPILVEGRPVYLESF